MANENIRELDIYQVEFTRLDEQEVVSYNIAVAPGQTEVQAIEKGLMLFLAYGEGIPNFKLLSAAEVKDPEVRRNANPAVTYWRNRAQQAGKVHF